MEADMKVAKCECGSMIFEIGGGGEDKFWVHADIPAAEQQNCGFVEGSEQEVSSEEYNELMTKANVYGKGEEDEA